VSLCALFSSDHLISIGSPQQVTNHHTMWCNHTLREGASHVERTVVGRQSISATNSSLEWHVMCVGKHTLIFVHQISQGCNKELRAGPKAGSNSSCTLLKCSVVS
jgi:hypothetical protein